MIGYYVLGVWIVCGLINAAWMVRLLVFQLGEVEVRDVFWCVFIACMGPLGTCMIGAAYGVDYYKFRNPLKGLASKVIWRRK